MSQEQKEELTKFIKEYYQLLTAMGVFGGLTAIFARLENASFLTVLSFTVLLILGIEFWRKIPKSKPSLSLFVFQNLIITLMFGIGVYLFLFTIQETFSILWYNYSFQSSYSPLLPLSERS